MNDHREAPDKSLMLTVTEAAKLLRISERTAWRRVKDGQIPTVRLGGRVLVPRSQLEAIAKVGA
jgi:excisionase family DNA binding protein